MNNAIILMLIFSGAILLYALLLAWTKDIGLIRRSYAAKIKDRKTYAVQFAKVLALTAIAPALAGLAGFVTENVLCFGLTFIISLIAFIRIGIKLFMKEC